MNDIFVLVFLFIVIAWLGIYAFYYVGDCEECWTKKIREVVQVFVALVMFNGLIDIVKEIFKLL